jgi:hypothetical protein
MHASLLPLLLRTNDKSRNGWVFKYGVNKKKKARTTHTCPYKKETRDTCGRRHCSTERKKKKGAKKGGNEANGTTLLNFRLRSGGEPNMWPPLTWGPRTEGGAPQVRDDVMPKITLPPILVGPAAPSFVLRGGLAYRGARAYWSLARGPGGGSGPTPRRGRVGFPVTTQ